MMNVIKLVELVVVIFIMDFRNVTTLMVGTFFLEIPILYKMDAIISVELSEDSHVCSEMRLN